MQNCKRVKLIPAGFLQDIEKPCFLNDISVITNMCATCLLVDSSKYVKLMAPSRCHHCMKHNGQCYGVTLLTNRHLFNLPFNIAPPCVSYSNKEIISACVVPVLHSAKLETCDMEKDFCHHIMKTLCKVPTACLKYLLAIQHCTSLLLSGDKHPYSLTIESIVPCPLVRISLQTTGSIHLCNSFLSTILTPNISLVPHGKMLIGISSLRDTNFVHVYCIADNVLNHNSFEVSYETIAKCFQTYSSEILMGKQDKYEAYTALLESCKHLDKWAGKICM